MKKAKEIMKDIWRRAKNTTKKERWTFFMDLFMVIVWFTLDTPYWIVDTICVTLAVFIFIVDTMNMMFKEELKNIRGEE